MNKRANLKIKGTIFSVLLISLLVSGSAFGAGFALIEQSVSGLGNAFAGGAASAEDATTIFFNPAGLSRIKGTQFIGGVHVVIPTNKFDNEGSTHVLQPLTTVPLMGGNGGDGGVTGIVPNAYISRQINDRFTFGLGINVPFGLETDYDSGWVGRYHALNSELLTVNINPTLAFRINENLSVGIGLSAQYLDATLSNAIDFGTLDALPVALGGFGGAFALIPQAADGHVELTGDSWGYGFNLGLLYEFNQNTRIGLAYRSRVKHDIEGDADFTSVPPGMVVATGGWFTDTDVEADLDLPDNASVSLFHQINPQWAVMADVTWTNWELFDEIRFEFASGQPDGVTTEDWDDNFRYSVGVNYLPSQNWIIRGGAAYDETPIPDAARRTPRLPGEDRFWLATGFGYKFSDSLRFNIGYAHLFIEDPEIRKTPTGEDAIRGGLTGTYDSDADIVSAQISWTF
jgi:long-chain fatty acid transport protein